MKTFVLNYQNIGISDVAIVGGKNASLGEMFNQLNPKGVQIPDGFALNADAYRLFRKENMFQMSFERTNLSYLVYHLEDKHRKMIDIFFTGLLFLKINCIISISSLNFHIINGHVFDLPRF